MTGHDLGVRLAQAAQFGADLPVEHRHVEPGGWLGPAVARARERSPRVASRGGRPSRAAGRRAGRPCRAVVTARAARSSRGPPCGRPTGTAGAVVARGPPVRSSRRGPPVRSSRRGPPVRSSRRGPPVRSSRRGPPVRSSRRGPPVRSSRRGPPVRSSRRGPPVRSSRRGPPVRSSRRGTTGAVIATRTAGAVVATRAAGAVIAGPAAGASAVTARGGSHVLYFRRFVSCLKRIKGRPANRATLVQSVSGDVLLSHAVARAVPSALRGLASGFGMGPGVSLSLWSPKLYGDMARTAGLLIFDRQRGPYLGNCTVDASAANA